MLKHPLPIGKQVEYNAKRCNCTFMRKDIRSAKIISVRQFNNKYWYGLDSGMQVGQEKIIKVIT